MSPGFGFGVIVRGSFRILDVALERFLPARIGMKGEIRSIFSSRSQAIAECVSGLPEQGVDLGSRGVQRKAGREVGERCSGIVSDEVGSSPVQKAVHVIGIAFQSDRDVFYCPFRIAESQSAPAASPSCRAVTGIPFQDGLVVGDRAANLAVASVDITAQQAKAGMVR